MIISRHFLYFVFSLALHVILIVMIIFHPDKSRDEKKKKLPDDDILRAYVITEITKETIIKPEKKLSHFKKTSVNKLILNKIRKINSGKKILQNTNAEHFEEAKKNKKTLLSLLHQAILEKQSYPEFSEMLNETGTTRIRFMLYPDGHINQIALVKSSGFANLDTSAVTALKAIVPVLEAKTYLHKETFFSVDVVFG